MRRVIIAAVFLLAGQAALAAAVPEMILMGSGRPAKAPAMGAGFKALAGALKNNDANVGVSGGSVHADGTSKTPGGPDPAGYDEAIPPGPARPKPVSQP